MNRPGDRIIGVLGGMGPMAGAWFMQRLGSLTPAQDDSEHVPAILVNDPRVPDRVAPILGRGADPLPAMLAGVTRLEAAGAGAVAIACNTAHRWHGEIASATSLTVLDMVAAAVEELSSRPVTGPVGLLATRGTVAAGIYQRALAARGHEILLATEELDRACVLPAIAAVKAGAMEKAEKSAREAARQMQAAGAREILVACTELSVCWPRDFRKASVDACDALARAALHWAGALPL
jgi:aspartate racemase